jgi:hypothetical protein
MVNRHHSVGVGVGDSVAAFVCDEVRGRSGVRVFDCVCVCNSPISVGKNLHIICLCVRSSFGVGHRSRRLRNVRRSVVSGNSVCVGRDREVSRSFGERNSDLGSISVSGARSLGILCRYSNSVGLIRKSCHCKVGFNERTGRCFRCRRNRRSRPTRVGSSWIVCIGQPVPS